MSEIEELYNKKIISTRTHNLCLVNKLDSLEKLHRFYKKRGSFISLDNCGLRSNLELIDICKKFEDKNQLVEVDGFQEINFNEILEQMPDSQLQILQAKIQNLIGQLDNRTKNAISLYLKHDFSFENLIEKEVLLPHFSVNKIKGLGQKTGAIATEVFNQIRSLLTEPKPSFLIDDVEEVKSIYLKYFPQDQLAYLDLTYESYFNNCEYLLQSKILFTNTERMIIQHGLILYKGQKLLTSTELQERLKLSSREVSLLKQKTINKIKNNMLFLKDFRHYFEAKNRVNSKVDVLQYPYYIFEKIRDLHNVNFSDSFISFLIGIIYKDSYKSVGYYKSCLGKLEKKRIKFNSKFHFKIYHQVNSKLAKKCDFGALIAYIHDNQIHLNQLSDHQKIELVSCFSSSQLPQVKLRLLECAKQILEKEIK